MSGADGTPGKGADFLVAGEQTGWALLVEAALAPCTMPTAGGSLYPAYDLQWLFGTLYQDHCMLQMPQEMVLTTRANLAGHPHTPSVSWLAHNGRPVLIGFWVPGLAPGVVVTADLHGSLRFWSVAMLLQVHSVQPHPTRNGHTLRINCIILSPCW